MPRAPRRVRRGGYPGSDRLRNHGLLLPPPRGAGGGVPPPAVGAGAPPPVNGKAPREKDKKDRAGCTDANPLSTEPLAFLLPAHRAEYTFASGGFGKGKDRDTLVIEFTSAKPEGKGELAEDPRGHADCFHFSMPAVMKGRVWVDAASYQVVRVEQRMAGMADLSVPAKLQRKHNLDNNVIVERHDTTIRYKTIPFHDPDEAMLLPESIETFMVMRGGLESIRSRQAFTDYRRFLTAGTHRQIDFRLQLQGSAAFWRSFS